MKFLIVLLLLLSTSLSQAQNEEYRLFQDGVQYLYGEAEGDIDFGIKLNGDCDSTYANISSTCFTLGIGNAYQSSFAGFEVCQEVDTTFLRLKGGHMAKLLPRAGVGQSWKVKTENNIQILAKVDSVRLETFLGLTDSVKYISFHGRTLEEPSISNIRIGKATGLLNAVYFWNLLVCREEIMLTGLSEPRAGLQYDPVVDFFTPDIGQEIHFSEEIPRLCVSCPDSSYRRHHEYKMVLEEFTENADSNLLTYNYRGSRLSYRILSSGDQTPYDSILLEGYHFLSTISREELQAVGQQPGAVVSCLIEISGEVRPSIRRAVTPLIVENDDCFGQSRRMGRPYLLRDDIYLSSITDVPHGNTYVQGAGIRIFEARTLLTKQVRKLVYFKDDTRECGTPYDFTGIVSTGEIPQEAETRLYPNPATEETVLSLPTTGGLFDVLLTDLDGRQRRLYPGISGVLNLETGKLAAGVYIVRVSRGTKIVRLHKLVVR